MAIIKKVNKTVPKTKETTIKPNTQTIVRENSKPIRKPNGQLTLREKKIQLKKIVLKQLEDNFKNESDFISVSKKKTKLKEKKINDHIGCVIKIKPIPHGFYENELTKYFRQFGPVVCVKVVRAKNSLIGHTAYVRFEDKEIANTAAASMNNYIMFETKMKTSISDKPLPINKSYKANVAHRAFKNIFNLKEKLIKDKIWEVEKHNNLIKPNESQIKELNERLISEQIQRDEIKSVGIDYKFEGYQEVLNKAMQVNKKPDPKQQKQSATTKKTNQNKDTTSTPKPTPTPIQKKEIISTPTKTTPKISKTPEKLVSTSKTITPTKTIQAKEKPSKPIVTKSTPEKLVTPIQSAKKLVAKKSTIKK